MLNISNEEFCEKLKFRIYKANELLKSAITNNSELISLEREFSIWNRYNSEYLYGVFEDIEKKYKMEYDYIEQFSIENNESIAGREYVVKENIKNKISVLKDFIELSDLMPSSFKNQPDFVMKTIGKEEQKKVFIVHGHDTASEVAVARTLERLGLEPIILHEQANGGRTVIEKFEHNSDVGFAVVILSADDLGKAKTSPDLNKRARQNVVLELGYFIGKLGRHRVIPLYEEDVEIPSDLSGIVYVPLDKHSSWKFALVKELQNAGYNVNANNLTK